jgi:hypothetical protein
MLLRAARAPRKLGWRSRTIALDVGQLAVSVREFATANELTHKEVRLHLERLVREGMITIQPICGSSRGTAEGADKGTKAAALGSLITICNFSRFQLSEEEVGAQMGTALGAVQGADTGTAGAQQGHTEQEVGELEKTHPDKPESETPTENKNGGKPPRTYAFQGPGKMRVTQADYDAWEAAFQHLDLRAKLQQRADWYREKGEVPAGWFMATSNWLTNENQAVAERIKARAEELRPPNLRYPPGHPFWSTPG